MKKSFYSLCLGFLCILFASCSNFLNGQDFLEKFQDTIDYVSRPYVTLNIVADNVYTDSISPVVDSYTNRFKCGDEFQLTFKPSSGYKFNNWIVEPEGAVSFESEDSPDTKVKILINGEITITPACLERPKITAFTPAHTNFGIDRGSDIKIYFDQPMSIDSIYYTAKEIEEITGKPIEEQPDSNSVSEGRHNKFLAKKFDPIELKIKKITNNFNYDYYYAYKDGNSIFYKNIFINLQGENESLLIDDGYFGSPYFETDYILVIPTKKDNSSLPLPNNSDIEVIISGKMRSKDNIELGTDYKASYRTGSSYDIEGPLILKNEEKDKRIVSLKKTKDGVSIIPSGTTQSLTEEIIQNPSSSIDYLLEEGLINIKQVVIDDVEFVDESGIKEYYVILYPIANSIYGAKQSSKTIYGYHASDNAKKDTFTDPNFLEFDFSNEKAEGIYQLRFYAHDIHENATLFDFVSETQGAVGTIITSKDIYVVLDNIPDAKESDFSFIKNGNSATVTGPAGKYLWVYATFTTKRLAESASFQEDCKKYYEENINDVNIITISDAQEHTISMITITTSSSNPLANKNNKNIQV